MMKTSLTFLKLAVAAAIAICLSVNVASAQSLKGTFTLPYDVQWGKAVLPAGPYKVTFDSSYPTGGEAVTAGNFGLGKIDWIDIRIGIFVVC